MQKILRHWPLWLLAAAALFYYLRYRTMPALKPQEVQATGTDGQKFLLADTLHGKSIIHVAASWCGPCLAELRELAPLQSQITALGWQLVLLSDDPQNKLNQLAQSFNWQGAVLHISSISDYGIHTIPATQVLDTNGKLLYSHIGPISWHEALSDSTSFLWQ